MVKSLTDFQPLRRHKVNTTTASNIKTCGETKVWMLNPNLASKISYERILINFQNEAVNRNVVLSRILQLHRSGLNKEFETMFKSI